MSTMYTEEVDENNIVQKEHYYTARSPKKPKEKGIIDEFEFQQNKHSHHTSDILLCGVLSGAIAGFVTNGLETLAVKKQTKKNFSITKYLRKPGVLKQIALKGNAYRTCYYGVQACLLFLLLEKLKVLLNVETMED